MKCPFYNCDNEEDNPNFDEPAAHMVIVVGALGHTHIHAPFEDTFIIKKMMDALVVEMYKNGIVYNIPKFLEKKRDLDKKKEGDVND